MEIRLRRMKGERRQHDPGDVFVLRLDNGEYLFGRIAKMTAETEAHPPPGEMLVYVYKIRSSDPEPVELDLTVDKLLMPPFFTIPWMWYKGYFRTVAGGAIQPGDLLAQHCFYSAAWEMYVDENDRILSRRYDMCGRFGLLSFEFLEEMIGSALDGEPIESPYRPGELPEKETLCAGHSNRLMASPVRE